MKTKGTLTLWRYAGEELNIGPDIRVVVDHVSPSRACLRITAPLGVAITRPDMVKKYPPPRRE